MNRISMAIVFTVLAFLAGIGVYYFFSPRDLQDAEGSYLAVTVLCDPALRSSLEPSVSLYMQKVVTTPQEEKIFRFHFADSSFFLKGLRRRYIVILCDLSQEGFTKRIVRSLLPLSEIERAKNEGMHLVLTRDYKAKNQIVAVFLSENTDYLRALIELRGSYIRDMIDSSANSELARAMFTDKGRPDEILLEREIKNDYGFSVSIPKGFWHDKGTSEENFSLAEAFGT
jgi:hypothetical protein